MIWQSPLGFLGLLGIILLIIIYILRPNYQNKVISTTFIWKLSLKYRKKKLPINLLRNIIILICQILIITFASLILTQPFLEAAKIEDNIEKVAVIDASANMNAYCKDTNNTRFERAIELIRVLSTDTINAGEKFTVIVATNTPYVLAERTDDAKGLSEELDKLKEAGSSFATADVDAAMDLAENVTLKNPSTEVFYYTATTYLEVGKVHCINVDSKDKDSNIAILDVRAEFVDKSYEFSVDVISYVKDAEVNVTMTVNGVNAEGFNIEEQLAEPIECINDKITTVTFVADNFDEDSIYSFESAFVSIADNNMSSDSFPYDDSFYLYGGKKETIKVLYASSLLNPFIGNLLNNISTAFKSDWKIDVYEFSSKGLDGSKIPTTGYDLYVYEHNMPDTLPKDGVSLLINPNKVPYGADFKIGEVIGTSKAYLDQDMDHELLNAMNPSERLFVNQFVEITNYDGYESLLSVNGDSVYLSKNTAEMKVSILGFSIHYSNLAISTDFPIMFVNFFNYYFPATLEKTVFEVGETVNLDARGPELNIDAPGLERITFTDFPASIVAANPGIYTVTQDLISGKPLNETFFVRISTEESNFSKVEHVLTNPEFIPKEEPNNLDLLVYLAAAMVTFLFIEWYLQSKDQF